MRTKHLSFLLGVSLVCLTSCTLYRSNLKHTDRLMDKINANLEQPYNPADEYKMDTIAVKDDIWLGDQSIRASEGDPLPARFETEDGITLVSTTPVSLLQISEQITSLTGITVRFDDMIINEVRDKGASASGDTGDASGGVQENTSPDLFMPSYSGKLSGLLDQIASRFALWWKYKNGTISFYKMETRVFTVYALPTTSSVSASVGDMSTGANLKFWEDISNTLKTILPDGANLTIIESNGTITVTAPPFTLQRIAQYINSLNDKMSRQVAISVKVLNVTLSDASSAGINFNSVFSFFKKAGEKLKVTLANTTVPTGQLSMVLTPGDKHIGNTNFVMDALNEQGKTSLVTSASVTTLNNRIAPIQIATEENYISKVETTINSDSSTTAIQTDKLNYGFTMEVLPRILDHGRLLVMFNLSLTQLEDMKEKSAGGDESKSTVMLPKVKTRGFTQEIAMTSGSTLLLSGFEDVKTVADKTTGMFEASSKAEKERNVLVILLTPEVLVSPLSPETRMKNL